MQNLAIGLVLIGLALLLGAVLVLYQFVPDLGLTPAPALEVDAPPEDEDALIEISVGGEVEEIVRDAQERMSLENIRKVIEEQPSTLTPSERDTLDQRGRFKHVVRKGETLSSLARVYLGDASNWQVILDANPSLLRPEDLREGQTVLIPSREAR